MEQIAERNDAICQLIGFKTYLPKRDVKQFYTEKHGASSFQLKWWHLPNVGNFNSFDLRFHADYNWLMSAVLEFKKYKNVDRENTHLSILFNNINNLNIFDITLSELWFSLSEYAVRLLKQKALEHGDQNSQESGNRS